MKQVGGLNLLCVPIAHITDGAMKYQFFYLSYGSSIYYWVKVVMNPIILNNTSLISVTLCC